MSSDTEMSISDDDSSTRNNSVHTAGPSSTPGQPAPTPTGSYVFYGYPYPYPPQTPVPGHHPPQTPVPAHLSNTSTTLPLHFPPQPLSSQKPRSQATASGFSGDTLVSDPNLRKLENILQAIADEKWTFGVFLYYFFRVKDSSSQNVKGRSRRHSAMLSKFLEGAGAHTPSSIVKEWYQNPIGCPHPEHAEHQKMFSVAEPFETIKYARPALTSFAAQLVEAHLLTSADKMVSPEGGLHTSHLEVHTSFHDSDSEMENSEDQTIMSTTQNLLQNGFPLLWHYCTSVASPKRRQRLSRAKSPS
jgi:hypothetical protein